LNPEITDRTSRRAIATTDDYWDALSGGRRNFASVAAVQARRFDVLVDEPTAAAAALRLEGADRAPHQAN
jgi:ABC-type glutathione transport system ATPase component